MSDVTVRSILLGIVLGGIPVITWIATDELMKYLDPKIKDWIYSRSRKRLVATGQFTEEEARELTDRWRREREEERKGL